MRIRKQTAAPMIGNDDRVVAGVVGDDDDPSPDQGGNRVEPAAQDGGDLADEDVAQHAAADPGDRAEDHGVDDAEAMGQGGGRAGDAEQRQAGGVKCVDRALEAVDRRVREGRQEPGAGGHGQVAPVAERLRRDADQQVANGAAGDPHDHGQHDRPEQVELFTHAGHAAAEAEHERPDQVEDEQQGRAEPGQQGRGRHRGVRRGYSASQAQVAVTSVSTPVSSVGWMTGANFGLWLVGISLSRPSRSALA